MCDRTHMPTLSAVEPLCYEELVAAEADDYEWPALDENTAATLCYTSGTTGNPKGVLYSHRSTLMQALASALPDLINLSTLHVGLRADDSRVGKRLAFQVYYCGQRL